jgi:hypothetical protein
MGPTKVVLTTIPPALPPHPVIIGAHDLLDQLYEETQRLLREKEQAIHHLARALMERDELIGEELEEVFAEAEAQNPELLQPFERKLLQFRPFAPQDRNASEAWTPPTSAQPAADVPAAREPDHPAATVRPPWAPPLTDR